MNQNFKKGTWVSYKDKHSDESEYIGIVTGPSTSSDRVKVEFYNRYPETRFDPAGFGTATMRVVYKYKLQLATIGQIIRQLIVGQWYMLGETRIGRFKDSIESSNIFLFDKVLSVENGLIENRTFEGRYPYWTIGRLIEAPLQHIEDIIQREKRAKSSAVEAVSQQREELWMAEKQVEVYKPIPPGGSVFNLKTLEDRIVELKRKYTNIDVRKYPILYEESLPPVKNALQTPIIINTLTEPKTLITVTNIKT